MAVLAAALMFLHTLAGIAQVTNPSTYDLRFSNGQGGCGSNSFCVDIQIKAASGAPNFALGSHTIWFNYNKSVIGSPTYTSLNFNSSTQCSIAGVVNYNPYLSTAFNFSEAGSEGEANFTTLLNAFTAGFECPVVNSSTWVTMGTVCFTVLNSSGNPNLYFSPQFTLINMSNNNPQHNPGTWGTLNSLPGGSSGSPGTASFSNPFVCAGETVNFSATGFSVNAGYYIGLIVTDNASVSSPSSFLAATKYLVSNSSSASAFNGPPSGTGMPTNTPLYVYSFVGLGSGSSLQIDPSCFAVSPAAGPFVVLQTIQTSASNYTCLGGGSAVLNIAAAGGLPAYNNPAQKFTVTTQNAVYTGPSQINNNQIITVTVTNNVPWTVTFTDSDGCQGVATGTFVETAVCTLCNADAGNVSVNKQFVCWDETIQLTASGYTLGNPTTGYVGLAVSPDNTLNDLLSDVLYGLYTGPTANHTNNDLAETNQTLYAYSFIGEGNPYSFNPSCFDLSSPSASFVLLQPILINTNNQFTYNCNTNGTATIAMAPAGGAPAYNSATEKFTVSVSGSATYSGPSQINNGQSINITVSNGAWTVTFTDSKGCSKVISNTFNSADCGAPPPCNANAGTPARSKNFVCWGDPITFSASGFTLGNAGSYVGLAVSPTGNLTSLSGAAITHLFQGTSVTFTNNQNTALGQPLYLYSFIGEGTPLGTINPNCTALSAPTAQFVLLQQVLANKSAYVCNSGGTTAQVGVAAAGGMPLYQSGQQFTVTVTGATYSGPSTVNNNTTITLTVANGATWSVTFTDSQGCSATISDTFNAAVACAACAANAGPDQSLCATTTTLAATPAPAGGSGTWSVATGAGAGSFANPNSATTTVSGLLVGVNKLVWSVTQPSCPIVRDTVAITVLTGAACGCCNDFAAQTSGENSTCGLADGRLEAVVSGGSGNYTVQWVNAVSGTPVANPLAVPAGVYQATINDTGCGCTSIVQVVQVTADAPAFGLQASATNVNDCENVSSGQICLTIGSGGTAPYTVSMNGSSYGPYAVGSHCIPNLAPGTYNITVTDANGCAKNAPNQSIIQLANCETIDCANANLLMQSNILPTNCGAATGQVCLIVTGGTPPYTLANGTVIEQEAAQTCISNLGAGSYNFTVTDANGCTAAHSATVAQPAAINVLATAQNAGCGANNGSFCLTISGGTGPYSVVSSGAPFGTFANNQQQCVNNVAPGLYILTITDLTTGCTATESVAIGQNNNNINIATQTTPATCTASGGVCLTFTGGNAPYTVSGVSAITGSFSQAQQRCFGGLAPGAYNYTVTDASGCSKAGSFTITGGSATLNITANTTSGTCQTSGSVCIIVSGGAAPYTPSGVAGISGSFANNQQQCFNLTGGSYTVTLTDANGCTGSKSFTINQTNNNINVNLSSTPAGCAGLGSVCVSFTGGTAPYIVSGLTLINGSYAQNQQQCFNGFAAGSYTFTVTDAQGCTKQHSFTVGGSTSGITTSVQTTNPSCANNDGVVCFNISGGTPPYQITGTSGQVYGSGFNGNQNCVQGFAAGAYSFNIVDAQGCTATATAILQAATGCGGEECENTIFACSSAGATYNVCPEFCDLGSNYQIILINGGNSGTGTPTNSGTCMSFVPASGFSGLATIYVVACSNPNTCETLSIQLTVGTCGQAPVAVADAFTVTQSILTCLNVLANDYDVDGSVISMGTFSQPQHGSVVANPTTGELCYHPDFGYTGPDSFTYNACDAIGCNQTTVSINVTLGTNTTVCNNPANTGIICTTPQTPVNVCVQFCNLNASAAITDVASAFNCGLTIQSNNCVQFTPLPGQTGNNQLLITACDNTGACEVVYVTVQISANCSSEPCNNPTNLCTAPVTPVSFCVDFCNLTGVVTIQEVHTTFDCGITILPNNCIQYLPLPGFLGNDVVEVTGCNGLGQCETILIPISVSPNCNEPEPCENPDNLCTTLVTPIEFCVEFCDLNNTASITQVHPTYDCGITLLANNCVQYIPLPGYTGIDPIEVIGCDNTGACQTIVVHVNVAASCGTATNLPPVAVDDAVTTPFNTPITIPVLVNDSDPNGDPISITAFTQPLAGGTVTQSGNSLIFTPTAGFSGSATFNYTICDPQGLCDVAAVTVVVQAAEPCTNPDNLCTQPMTPLQICVQFCSLNASAQVTDVTATFNCGLNILTQQGCIEYLPLPGFLGPEVLTITGCDNTGQCETVIVNVTVQADCGTAINLPPVAIDDAVTTPFNTPVTITVLANDSDPNGDPINLTAFTQPLTGGTVTQLGNSLIFTPTTGFTGTATFNYTICDPQGLCDAAVVTVVVQAAEPCTNPNNLCTQPMTPLQICVQFCNLNASAQVTDVTATFNCGLNILPTPGCIQYIPLPGFFGPEVLTITGCDDTGQCETVIVNVTVQEDCTNPTNNPPVAVDDAATTPQNTPVTIIVLANDFDPDGNPISITATTPPSHGTITPNASGTGFIYTPNTGYTGFDSFTYQICDNQGLCDVATVTIEITDDCPSGPPAFVCAEPMIPTIICPEFCDLDPASGITITSVTATFNCGVNLLDNGCIQYTPLPGYIGQDSLIIIGCNNAGVCDTTVVYSFVTCAAPIAFPDAATTPNTQPITVNVLANDIGICSDDIIVTVLTQPTSGSASVNATNQVIYTPQAGFTGTVTFTYTVCDLCSPTACDETTVTITVTGGGPPPVDIQPDVVQTPFETPIQINVLANDFGANLTITQFTQPDNGTVTYSPDGTQLIYTPDAGFSGVDYFFYTACNSLTNVCGTTIVSVTVLPPDAANLPPTANNDMVSTPFETPALIPVLANDSDPEGQPLTVTFVSNPANGTALIVGNQVLYTPNTDFTGFDTFTYVICDNGTPALCDTATVGVAVGLPDMPNNPPLAVADEAFTDTDMPVTIPVLANDSDPDGDQLTVSIGSDPANGTVVINPDNTTTYTPNTGFIGIDYFTYIICDNGTPSLCDTAWVTIYVGPMGVPPIAVDDEVCVSINEPVEIFVLSNDLDSDGGILLITLLTQPQNGEAFVSLTGSSVAYIPNIGFQGVDGFTYQICDPTGQCDTATVTVYVDAGINLQPDIYFVQQNTSLLMFVLENDFGAQLYLDSFTQPANGTLVSSGNALVYIPTAGYVGQDYFTYTACDCAGACQTTLVAIIVIPSGVGNLPPIAFNDYASTPINTPVTIPVLDNDSDPNGDPLIITDIFDLPNPDTVGTPQINEDSTAITFTPAPGFEGCITFGYVVCDNGNPALCDTAFVAVQVGNTPCLNLPPLALSDTVATTVETPVTIDVLINDTDPDGDPLAVVAITDPLNGSAEINPDNTIVYTPNPGFIGTDYFTYIICDNGSPSLCDTAYVVITIQPEAVQANPDIYYTIVNVPITVNILTNDTGAGIFIVGISTPPMNGLVSINDAILGTVTYTPTPGFIGTDYFEYVICNSPTNCDTTLVTVIVQPDTEENLPPVAVNDVATTPINEQVCIPVLNNDFDPLGGTAILISGFDAVSVNGGSVTQVGEQLCFTPPQDYIGLDSLTYIICDNFTPALCDTGVVVINVGSAQPSNNPPLAADDAYTTPVDTPITVNILANDSDPDGDLITITFLSTPMMGTVTDAGSGNITYTPNPGAIGTDFLSYIICDNGSPSLCDTAYVTITITDGPPPPPGTMVAQPDIATTAPGIPVTIPILANDLGNPLPATITLLDSPNLGAVVINPVSGVATYTPNPGVQDTTDYFVYQVCNDLGDCDSTLVTIIILPAALNQCPSAANDVAFTPQDTQVCVNVLANDNDPFGGSIVALVTFGQPANGVVTFLPDSVLCYQPNSGFCGLDSFTYVICDNGSPSCCDTATVVINVCATVPSNNPPLAQDDTAFTSSDIPVVINILANDSDPDGDDFTVTFISEPCGIVTLNADGVSVTYTPIDGCGPTDYFSYVICDNGTPSLCDTAYVTISILSPPPPDNTITEETPEDTPIEICVTDPAYNLDFDGITPTVVVLQTPPANGTVTGSSATCITYTPAPNYCGPDTFELLACDDSGNCVTITVLMTVTCVPNPPIAVDDNATTLLNTPVTIPVLANDSDPDDPTNPNAISILDILTDPVNGIALVSGDSIIYTPNVGFTGCDTFTYVIQDLDLLTDTAEVVVCVTPDTTQIEVIAINDTTETLLNTPVVIPVLANDTFPNQGQVTVQVFTNPASGSATATQQGNSWIVTYTPNVGFTGLDSLQYLLCELPAGATSPVCDTAWVFINVVSCDLIFASGFSPNDDNVNDAYLISNLDNITECFPDSENEILIFNRWGDMVYKQLNYTNADPWRGTWITNGEPVPDGTYFYIFTLRDANQKEIVRKQGYIEVHR